ncbi:MAG: polysaccharide biosynthesis protein, partial [Bacteroidota bacterium]
MSNTELNALTDVSPGGAPRWKHPVQSLRDLFFRGHKRTRKAKKNIAGLFVIRGVISVVNLLLVPLTLAYLDQARYGVWMTLTSIIGWAGILDIGLGNGLRNKLAESIAKGDENVEQTYVSTTYAFVALIAALAIVLFSLVNPFLTWSKILNASASMDTELGLLAQIVFVGFCLKLVFNLIGTVLIAHQRPAAAGAIEAFVGVISLGVVWFLTRTTEGSLFWLGIAITAPMVVGPLLANVWFFRRQYRRIRPRI